MKPFNRQPPGLSLFELALGRGGQHFLIEVLNRWPPDLVFRLYTLNYNMHHFVRFYVRRAWDPQKMLFRWFDNPEGLLSTLKVTNAIVCGPVALKYFDRNHALTKNIDICVRLDGIRELGRFLIGEKYTFCPAAGDPKHFDTTILLQSGRKRIPMNKGTTWHTWKADPYIRRFDFIRCAPLLDGETDTMTVAIHLVTWEPLRFILCMESSELVFSTSLCTKCLYTYCLSDSRSSQCADWRICHLRLSSSYVSLQSYYTVDSISCNDRQSVSFMARCILCRWFPTYSRRTRYN